MFHSCYAPNELQDWAGSLPNVRGPAPLRSRLCSNVQFEDHAGICRGPDVVWGDRRKNDSTRGGFVVYRHLCPVLGVVAAEDDYFSRDGGLLERAEMVDCAQVNRAGGRDDGH